MKKFLKKIINFSNKFVLSFNPANFTVKKNNFYFFGIKANKNNDIVFQNSDFEKSKINVTGDKNRLVIKNSLVSDTTINISGDNNQLMLGDGVKLRSAEIIIRGDRCSVFIGKNTTFGGIRIVNVGSDCTITIGEDCMFADYIELWASDTHPIYNKQHKIINREMPITIGNKVWVGSHVIVLKGVSIGNGSVIGMGSIVTKDVSAQVVSVGNPNRTVREDISWSLSCLKA